MAGRAALESGLAFNLGGGFHHAKPTLGEGFSIYNDIAVLVRVLRAEGRIEPTSRVVCVDLDAHMGNGVAWCFRDDPTVFLFDMHNGSIYPLWDLRARERIDCPIELPPGCPGTKYLERLQAALPAFLDSVTRSAPVALAIYNAGTDVLAGDALGGLELSLADVLQRDQFVLQLLRSRSIPTVVTTSGGYSNTSYLAIANTMIAAARGHAT